MSGKQIDIEKIDGGMLFDVDPRKLGEHQFKLIQNAEYDRKGNLIKSPGYQFLINLPGGPLSNLLPILNEVGESIGYLVGNEDLYFTPDLSLDLAQWTYLNKVFSPLREAAYLGKYYVGDKVDAGFASPHLRKVIIQNSSPVDYAVGVPVPSGVDIYPSKVLAAAFPHRINVKDLDNNDDSMILSLVIGAGTEVEELRPTGYTYYRTDSGLYYTFSDMSKGYDTDEGSYSHIEVHWTPSRWASTVGYLIYQSFEDHGVVHSSRTLKVKASGLGSSLVTAKVQYSINGGTSWTDMVSATGAFDSEYTASISDTLDLSLLKVRGGLEWHTYGPPSFLEDVKIHNIVLEGSGISSNHLTMESSGIHPAILGAEKIDKLVIPIKTNNLTTSRNVKVRVEQFNKDTHKSLGSETQTIAVADTDTEIEVTLGSSYYVDSLGDQTLLIDIFYDGATQAESLIFHRAKPWFISEGGKTRVLTPTVTEYTDREFLVALRVVNSMATGEYEYSCNLINFAGFSGNESEAIAFDIASGDVMTWNISSLLSAISAITEYGPMSQLSLNRSLLGGGSRYRLSSLSTDSLEDFQDDIDTFESWGSIEVIPPHRLIDGFSVPSATLAPTGNDMPEFQPLKDSLVTFRNRLFCLARKEATDGSIQTFLVWSEVDNWEVWPALNERWIPDLIEICPLRDDMLLGSSRNRTYLITPDGDSFTDLKIADVGVGGFEINSAYGVSKSTSLMAGADEAIYLVNDAGMWVFDGAKLSLIEESLGNLSIIEDLILSEGTLQVIKRDFQVWLCGDSVEAIDSGKFTSLVFDYALKKFIARVSKDRFYKIIEEGGKSDSPLYIGLMGAIALRISTYTEEGTAIESKIRSKRFHAPEGYLLKVGYFGLSYKIETGVLSLSFGFPGRSTVKTFTPSGSDYNSSQIEVYSETPWMDVEISHSLDSDFEIQGMFIGASTYTKGYLK